MFLCNSDMVRKTYKNTKTQKQYDIKVLLFCKNKYYILYIYKYIYIIYSKTHF